MYLHQHFGGSTGYGHEEAGGREALDQAFAEIFGAESAIVRSQVCILPIGASLIEGMIYFLKLLAFKSSFSQVLMQSPVLCLLS